jgi:signal transduction histidine kinase
MKLLAKTSLIYLLTTLLVFIIGGVIFYYNLRKIVDQETTERLFTEKSQVEDFVKAHDTIPGNSFTSGDFLEFTLTDKPVTQAVNDTILFSKEEGENLPFRQLTFPVVAKGKNYCVLVSKNLFEKDDLVEAILYSFISIILVLLVITLIVNRIAAGKLLKPFFHTVGQLNNFKLDNKSLIDFSPTSTKEFRALNTALEKMMEKISSDYKNLKAFTENASHELQTPLSVIMTTTELLLQDKNFGEKEMDSIQRIHQTARKLSKLNQTLLLLAKIENRQFEVTEKVDFGELLHSKMELYAELIAHKEITVKKEIEENTSIRIHPVLAEILISNLLTNAIRHSPKNGTMTVKLNAEKLLICNSGDPIQSAPDKLFERFYKENTSSESTGLGLALVKQIAETNGMTVNYSYTGNLHCFEVDFKA